MLCQAPSVGNELQEEHFILGIVIEEARKMAAKNLGVTAKQAIDEALVKDRFASHAPYPLLQQEARTPSSEDVEITIATRDIDDGEIAANHGFAINDAMTEEVGRNVRYCEWRTAPAHTIPPILSPRLHSRSQEPRRSCRGISSTW
jgi:hypothetical protein